MFGGLGVGINQPSTSSSKRKTEKTLDDYGSRSELTAYLEPRSSKPPREGVHIHVKQAIPAHTGSGFGYTILACNRHSPRQTERQ